MKTDRFTDIIRRKLESIRPEFTDKDWKRMQSSLRDANLSQPNTPGANHPFSGGVWSGQSWLLAAATISTVMLIAFSIWQRREINHLRQAIGNVQPHSAPAPLNPTSGEQTRPDIAHADGTILPERTQETKITLNRNEGQGVRPDTVYGTRYVAAPLPTRADIRKEERLAQHLKLPAEQRYATENPDPVSVTTPQSTKQTHNQQTEFNDESSTPLIAKNTHNESETANLSPKSSTRSNSAIGRTISGRNAKRRNTSPTNLVSNQENVAANTTAAPMESSAAASELLARYERATSLPVSMETKNWTAALAQRAKRMQPAQPTRSAQPAPVAEEPQVSSSQSVQRAATRFRAGVGGEVASRLWSVGVFSDVLIGRHWTIGAGLSQATYQNRFVTEGDFNDRTHRDFRNEFGRGIDPHRDIINIDAQQVRLQVPISLGYRISLSRTLTLLPTVGTFLNMTNSERVTYYCTQPFKFPQPPQSQRGFDAFAGSKSQPVALINSVALGAGIEWQRGHWVVQATPILTLPVQSDQPANQSDLNWQNNTTVSLRARLLYQF